MHPLEQHLLAHWPLATWSSTRQLVAVSGGADSLALLRALLRLAAEPQWIDVAHFNHRWRGGESDADEVFVRQECERLGVRLFVGSPETRAERLRSEESARQQRYQFLIETAYGCGARYVLTAHTASDRVETMLHNLFRGSGLAGLCSLPLSRPLDAELVLTRPLLGCQRAEVVDYLRELGQSFRNDASNLDTRYQRNFMRHELLPLLRSRYGDQVDERLLSASELAAEALECLRFYAGEYLDQARELSASVWEGPGLGFALPSEDLLPAPWPVVREAIVQRWGDENWPLQGMSREHWEQLRRYWEQSALELPAVVLPGDIQLTSRGGWLWLRPLVI